MLIGVARAGFVGAVADTVAEVHVCAEASDVVGWATQARSQPEHAVDAVFL